MILLYSLPALHICISQTDLGISILGKFRLISLLKYQL